MSNTYVIKILGGGRPSQTVLYSDLDIALDFVEGHFDSDSNTNMNLLEGRFVNVKCTKTKSPFVNVDIRYAIKLVKKTVT